MGTVLGFDAIAFWIVVTGALVGTSGALLGNYLVLQRMSLMGDAISHAVLPGIAVSFLITGHRGSVGMFLGALAAGLATVALTELIRRRAKVAEDAAMGVVFTSFFALGVVVISKVASQVDLDPGCVLYGILEAAALDTTPLLGIEVPRITITMAAATIGIVLFVLVCWKELAIVAFDPGLATSLGFNAKLVHYLLMGMVAAFTVAAFEAVGSILVVAMLVVPAATAQLLANRLTTMAVVSTLVGIASAVLGRWGALELSSSVSGMMAVAAGAQFTLAVLLGPRHGLLARALHQARIGLRITREDLLGMLYRWQSHYPGRAMSLADARAAVGGGWLTAVALWHLRQRRAIEVVDSSVALTEKGRRQGRGLVRGHRLWEAYVAKHFDIPADHLHEPAHRAEHFVDPALRRRIADELDHPEHDPHGQPIPPPRHH